MIRIAAILALLLSFLAPVRAMAEDRPVTLLISIDGFRPDYLDRRITPRLSALRAKGVFAAMRPSFPTKTFPNHTTIVTGLRPDHHGITGNTMIDPARPGQMFNIWDPVPALDPFWWGESEPLWITAEKQGVRTATAFWPGSEVTHDGLRPHDWLRYDEHVDNIQRVNVVLDWLRRPEAIRPKFVAMYFDTVDTAGHRFGIDSKEVNAAVSEVDTRIGELLDGIAAMGIAVNTVIIADHGMGSIAEDRVIQLETLIDKASYVPVETGPYAAIEPVTGTDSRVFDALLKPHEHMTCYRKEDLPKRLEYGKNPRVAAIICLAAPGWSIISGTPKWPVTGGNHGWDNIVPDMLALFLANGPNVTEGKTLPTFDNVDVYTFVASLAGVKPLPNDGSPHLIADTKRAK